MAGMDVLLANPRGFCAGVDRAIEIVDRLLDAFGAPIYVRHEVVHNRFVVDGLRRRGAVFVDELAEVPDGATVVFSAHGVSQSVRTEGSKRSLQVFDATCPLVTKVHIEVAQHCRAGRDVLMIGHGGHPEVEGTLGQWDGSNCQGARIELIETVEDARRVDVRDPDRLAFVTQTTLSVDDTREIIAALQERFPGIAGPRRDDICYATQNRQDAVRRLAEQCDLVLVVGSPNSSNSNRLRELAEKSGVPAFLIDGADDVRPDWLAGRERIGLTAGASAPESLVQDVVARLRALGADGVRELDGKPEDIVFALPRELRARLV
jgi:4-hydroxy-3-methylbut-2-enyl diphosphate reductase